MTRAVGSEVAKRIGAKYMECSAKTGQGVEEIFDLALKESMKGNSGMARLKKMNPKCLIL